jgi:hypothetical protein
MRTLALVLSALLGACAASTNLCDEASAHIAACLGRAAPAASTTTCEGSSAGLAAQALRASCDELLAGSPSAKADSPNGSAGPVVCVGLALPIFVLGQGAGETCCEDWNCQKGLICHQSACRAPGAIGASCDRAKECQGGLACAFHACAEGLAEGEKCDVPAACGDGDTCSVDHVCAAPAADGSPCKLDAQCEGQRCAAGSCITPFERLGPCSDDIDCQTGLVCINGACDVKPASGKACTRDAEGDGDCPTSKEICWDGVCSHKHELGEACGTMTDCSFGLFCDGGVCGH